MQFPDEVLRRCWFLTGATASGKSAVAMELAPRIGGEIIALDSMTLYLGMDIGTAKPTREERALVPHHLFDVIEPWEEFSVAQYLESALAVSREILGRGKVPLFVGGAGLYLRSLLRGVFDGPPANWELRGRWEAFAAQHGNTALHAELAQRDPASAQRLHINDQRRIIRALEVFEVTGRTLSEQHTNTPVQELRHVFAIMPPRDWLAERIERRLRQMAQQGLVAENLKLMEPEHPLSRTARQALGYKEIFDWLETLPGTERRPDLQIPEPVFTLMRDRTRQFAKRQETWFRNLEECRLVPVAADETAENIALRLMDGIEH
jgi:tRNA dimethylallyltransferase